MPFQAAELSTEPAIAAIAVLAITALLAVWLIPRRQRRHWQSSGVKGKDLADLENSARSTLVQLFGGVALILTFVATWLQVTDTRKATDRTLELTAAQQDSERFTRAVEQFGSRQADVRLGGIYGLQRVADDAPGHRAAVGQLMLAYLKSHHRLRQNDRRRFPKGIACSFATPVASPEAQAALAGLLSLPLADRPELDLLGVDLVGVRLPRADFRGAALLRASLAGSNLVGANFDGAALFATDLRGACLRHARFKRTRFRLTDLSGADLSGADLSTALISRGDIRDAITYAHTDACTRFPRRTVPRRCRKP